MNTRRGFSLIELALVLGISGLMVGFVLQSQQSAATADCYVSTRMQLTDINGAIQRFARVNERLPMPANRSVGVEGPTYGREASGAAIDTVGTTSWGALPFQALGLAPSYASDCWGNKFTYVVTTALTTNAASGGYLDSNVAGSIPLRKDASTNLNTTTAYAVISHGQDAIGAVKANYNGSSHGWCSGASLKYYNCLPDPSSVKIADAPFNNGKDAGTNYFDDLIVASGRPQLLNNTNLYCWGTDSGHGRLADNNATVHSSYVPQRASSNVKFAQLASVENSYHGLASMCGLTSDGTAYCWGSNATGQIGDGSTTTRSVPTAVNTAVKFYKLYMFQKGGNTGSVCGLMRNPDGTLEGTAYCWGDNTNGVLGIGAATNPVTTPTAVAGGLKFSMLSSSSNGSGYGFGVTCGIAMPSQDAYCWGNWWQNRGDGLTGSPTTNSPNIVVGGHKFSSIHVYLPACAITSAADALGAGKILCWGFANNGFNLWGSSAVVSNITQGNPAVLTTTTPHGLAVGDRFVVRGVLGMGAANDIMNHYGSTNPSAPCIGGTTMVSTANSSSFEVKAGNFTATTVNLFAYNWNTWMNTLSCPAYTGGGFIVASMKAAPAEVMAGSGLTFASLVDRGGNPGNNPTNIMAVTTGGRVYSIGSKYPYALGDGDLVLNPTNIAWMNSVTQGTSTTITTLNPHGLVTGDKINMQDVSNTMFTWYASAVGLWGQYFVNVTGPNTFILKTADNTDVDTSSFPPISNSLWWQKMPPASSCYDYSLQGAVAYCVNTPVEPTGAFTVASSNSVISNYNNTAMLTSNGNGVQAWGINRVGDGTTTDRATPVNVSGAITFQSLYRNVNGFCGIDTTNNAYCWGSNNASGDFGTGGTAAASSPTAVSGGLKFTTLLNLSYPGSTTQTVTCGLTGSTCGGVTVGGYCWYLSSIVNNCTNACASHGGYNNATQTYAGDTGTLANCSAVMTALNGSISSSADDAVTVPGSRGCQINTSTNAVTRLTGAATAAGIDASGGSKRACACNN